MALIDISTKKYPNMVAVVDAEDLPRISQWKWGLATNGGRRLYVRRVDHVDGRQKIVYLHRQIMRFPANEIDHIDGDTLNNSKTNLRECNHSQNMTNIAKRPFLSSKYKGVSWDESKRKWVAFVKDNKKTKNLGRYDNEVHAALAYDAAAEILYGEFARLNFQ